MYYNDIYIRDARAEEFDQIAILLKEAYQQYESSMPHPAWENYLENVMDVCSRLKEAELIVAEISGHLAGAVTLYVDSTKSLQEGWPAGWAGIRLLAVHPAYRGRGIGRALMEECVRRCRSRGITTIGLHTTELMAIARSMYEKMGFKRDTKFDFYPRPGVVVMAYRLDL